MRKRAAMPYASALPSPYPSYCQELCIEGSRGVLLHPESILKGPALQDLR